MNKEQKIEFANAFEGFLYIPKIENGSKIRLGNKTALEIKVDRHLNWFQKLMYKICFGFVVVDYTEE